MKPIEQWAIICDAYRNANYLPFFYKIFFNKFKITFLLWGILIAWITLVIFIFVKNPFDIDNWIRESIIHYFIFNSSLLISSLIITGSCLYLI